MYVILFFGIVTILISAVIVARPTYWSEAIIRFSEWRYFHLFEIITRLAMGGLFITSAPDTAYPTAIAVMGAVILAVGLGLMVTPPSLHRRFALWAAEKFRPAFRPLGVGSILFGLFLIYAALHGPATAVSG